MVGRHFLRPCACLLTALLASGCASGNGRRQSSPDPPATILLDGRTIDVTSLTEAVSALCQARREAETDPGMARRTYDRQSHDAVEAITEMLEPSYALLAGSLKATLERVGSAAATEPGKSSLADDLGRLAALTREGLARLGITTAACAG
jgi:hypothetical protein